MTKADIVNAEDTPTLTKGTKQVYGNVPRICPDYPHQ